MYKCFYFCANLLLVLDWANSRRLEFQTQRPRHLHPQSRPRHQAPQYVRGG